MSVMSSFNGMFCAKILSVYFRHLSVSFNYIGLLSESFFQLLLVFFFVRKLEV